MTDDSRNIEKVSDCVTVNSKSENTLCKGGRKKMLGGSFWISLLRNCMGAGLMLAVFLLLDRGRLPVKKAVSCYGLFGLLAAVVFSFWYMSDHENFVRFSGLLAIPAVGIFCIKMSGDT